MYSVYEKELIIGEIFVRVYNDQPSYPLEVSKLYYYSSFHCFGNPTFLRVHFDIYVM